MSHAINGIGSIVTRASSGLIQTSTTAVKRNIVTSPARSLSCTESWAALAESLGVASGYRIGSNVGPGGGQVVFHFHVHILSGPRQ